MDTHGAPTTAAHARRVHPTAPDDFSDLVDATECPQDDQDSFDASTPHDATQKLPRRYAVKRMPLIKRFGSMSVAEMAEAALGLGYLLFTLAMSVYYLHLLSPMMANDLWWPDFNASGAHTYLLDVLNAQLNVRQQGSVDFAASSVAMFKDYSEYNTALEMSPVYARVVVHENAQNLPMVISALRSLAGPEAVSTQYCWVDFNRTWEVAHTRRRQRRCTTRYAQNAAVYWETITRLVDWNTWMTKRGGEFNATMGKALCKTAQGEAWIRRTVNGFKDVASEVALWQQVGLDRFELQYTNQHTWGVAESIIIENALGNQNAISVKNVAAMSRGLSWTTVLLQWEPGNDLYVGSYFGYSFVRSDPAHQQYTYPCNYSMYLANPANYSCDPCKLDWNPSPQNCWPDYELLLGLPKEPVVRLVQDKIGPFGSIDAYFIPAPASLKSLYVIFQDLMTELAQSSDEFSQALLAVPGYHVDPVPPSWTNKSYLFMGGDPTCIDRQPLTFVQSSFAFDVSCTTQTRHTMFIHRFNTLFAIWAADDPLPESICSLCPTLSSVCTTIVIPSTSALTLLRQSADDNVLSKHRVAVQEDIVAMHVGIMQFAINSTDNSNAFLFEPVLSSDPSKWDVFGWVYLYEWAAGSREVVSYEGDNGVFALVSDKYLPTIGQVNSLEVPTSSCQFIWIVAVVVSAVLAIVGVVVVGLFVSRRGRIVGRNLLFFNRIVGSVWLGRPLLVIRGMTAIVLLSTSPLEFQVVRGLSRFRVQPRSFIDIMVATGEAMWLSYVVTDILLVGTDNIPSQFAPISTCLGWVVCCMVNGLYPYKMEAAVDRTCTVDFQRFQVQCTSGWVGVGSAKHTMLLVSLQIASCAVALVGVLVWNRVYPKAAPMSHRGPLLLSGTAAAFLHHGSMSGAWEVDRASCVMCGLLPFSDKWMFDVKSWACVVVAKHRKHKAKWYMTAFDETELNAEPNMAPPELSAEAPSSQTAPARLNRWFTLGGLLYVLATSTGSIGYLLLTSANMTNDFWWANYNASREHVYVSRLFNQQLLLRPHQGNVLLDDSKFTDDANYSLSSGTDVGVTNSPLYATQVVATDGSDLSVVIRGLRHMDGCLAPWISTQYCWLDFEKTWEMANTVRRQARCAQTLSTNAAVYLGSVLRNVHWDRLQSCWGSSLRVAFGKPLGQTIKGAQWWTSIQSVDTSVSDEARFWSSFGLTTFKTDWQNYKSVGIVDTFNIQNAFGTTYPLTLKSTNGSLHVEAQTSFKMYWSYASDLWAVTSPTSLMGGASLIRGFPRFAFATSSMEDVLIQNGTVQATNIGSGAFATFRNAIGPFGSIDLKVVPVPTSVVQLIAAMKDTLSRNVVDSPAFGDAFYGLRTTLRLPYVPDAWNTNPNAMTVGGNLLCDDQMPSKMRSGLYLLGSRTEACNSPLGETIAPSILATLVAVIGADFVWPDVPPKRVADACSQLKGDRAVACKTVLIQAPVDFLLNRTFFNDPAVLATWETMAKSALADLQTTRVELTQYGKSSDTTAEIQLLRHDLFDTAYPSFHFVGWLLVYDWAMAYREVIEFQGDNGAVNAITSATRDAVRLTNSLEIPHNVSSHIRFVCVYCCAALVVVAVLVMVYLISSGGNVEGINLMEMNRVAGIVWLGRALLCIRSTAAISLLSTQGLSLQPINQVWRFVADTNIVDESTADLALRTSKAILAAGEVSWLVYVLNDILSVFTQEYTSAYVIQCNILACVLSAALSLAFPSSHSATIHRRCEYDHVDFQLVCSNGTIEIGSVRRFWSLVGICVGSIVVCYCLERGRRAHSRPTNVNSSLLLSSSAKYMFNSQRWQANEVRYVDPASAAIHGILSVRWNDFVFAFDVKLWRGFAIHVPDAKQKRLERDGCLHLMSAIPLTE